MHIPQLTSETPNYLELCKFVLKGRYLERSIVLRVRINKVNIFKHVTRQVGF